MTQIIRMYGLLSITALVLLASQLLLKQGVRSAGPLSLTSFSEIGNLLHRIITSPLLLLGYGLSGMTALLWLLVLSRFEISFAAPIFSGIYYVLLLLASAFVLREEVMPSRWIGAALLIVGIGLISQNR